MIAKKTRHGVSLIKASQPTTHGCRNHRLGRRERQWATVAASSTHVFRNRLENICADAKGYEHQDGVRKPGPFGRGTHHFSSRERRRGSGTNLQGSKRRRGKFFLLLLRKEVLIAEMNFFFKTKHKHSVITVGFYDCDRALTGKNGNKSFSSRAKKRVPLKFQPSCQKPTVGLKRSFTIPQPYIFTYRKCLKTGAGGNVLF